MDEVMDKIKRWKILADLFVKSKTNVFIKEMNGDIHFCSIIELDDNYAKVKNFGPEQRKGKEDKIYWVQVEDFDEFKDGGR
jgi:hypothetical protein